MLLDRWKELVTPLNSATQQVIVPRQSSEDNSLQTSERLALVAANACCAASRWVVAVSLMQSLLGPRRAWNEARKAPRMSSLVQDPFRKNLAHTPVTDEKHFRNVLLVLSRTEASTPRQLLVLPMVKQEMETVRRCFVQSLTLLHRHSLPANAAEVNRHIPLYDLSEADERDRRLRTVWGNQELTGMLQKSRRRNNEERCGVWVAAVLAYHKHAAAQHANAVTQNILIQILGQNRRQVELSNMVLSSEGVVAAPNASTGKAIAEACVACGSWQIAIALLQHDNPGMALPITDTTSPQSLLQKLPSPLPATVIAPALIAVREAKHVAWQYALQWWTTLPLGSSHLTNQKLSSYVAQSVCLSVHRPLYELRLTQRSSTHNIPSLSWQWQTALRILSTTHKVNPARSVVFAVSAMRVACCWVKAVELYLAHEPQLLASGERATIAAVADMFAARHVANWVPGDVVPRLRKHFSKIF